MNVGTRENRFPAKWLVGLGIGSLLSLAAEFAVEKHPHVHYEHWCGFYGWAAVGTTIGIVLTGLLLRPLLWRDQGYYDG